MEDLEDEIKQLKTDIWGEAFLKNAKGQMTKMKIEGYDNCVNKISLRHKGKNVRFDCYVKPFLCEKRLDLERPKVAKINLMI